MAAARTHGNPLWIGYAYYASGAAYTESDPHRALDIFREGLTHTRLHRIRMVEAVMAFHAAGLEAVHGDLDQGLDLFDVSIDSFHQAGDTLNLNGVFVHLAMFFDRVGRPEIAATLCGTATHSPAANLILGFDAAVDQLRNTLDTDTFDNCVGTGAAMTTTEAVHYARHHIQLTRQHQP